MRVDRVKLTTHFDEFGVLKDTWIGLEAVIDDTETAESRLSALKEIEEQWYAKQNPHLQPQGPPAYPGPRVIEVKPEDREVGLTPELIMSCNDIVTLQSFYMLVEMSNRVDLKIAYGKRKEELVAKETKEILDATNVITDKINANPELKNKLLDGYGKNMKTKNK